jgi:hypothetical protein
MLRAWTKEDVFATNGEETITPVGPDCDNLASGDRGNRLGSSNEEPKDFWIAVMNRSREAE